MFLNNERRDKFGIEHSPDDMGRWSRKPLAIVYEEERLTK